MLDIEPKTARRKSVQDTVNVLLGCGDDVGAMKQAVDNLYRVFRSISAVGIDDQNTPDLFLPSGKAISPEKAAHCLLEMKRTAIFIRGIYKAINLCVANQNKRPVKILYVGTGPYATLVVPLLTLFTCEEVQVDLVEVNRKSILSALDVFKELELYAFVDRVFFADAAELRLEESYDIVVAEVMQAALKKEPQVAVMRNLIEQLGTKVIFIPEKIDLSATLVTGDEPSPKNNWSANNQTISLGKIFTLDKFRTQPRFLKNSLELPANLKENNLLYIDTAIRVFGDEKLACSDCSLTMPVKVCRFKKTDSSEISFWYESGWVPGVRCRLGDEGSVYEALDGRDHRTGSISKTLFL